MSAYKILRKGFDSLDVAFQGAMPSGALDVLRSAKALATSEGRAVLVNVGGIDGHVGETGAKGGYAFRFDTGLDGEIWLIKDSRDCEQWNLRVTVRAVQLALDGYDVVRDRLFEKLEKWGAKVITESVARADYAVDFIADELQLRPDDFVFHSHSRCQEHREIPEGGTGFSIERRSGRVTGITVGKMPGRQVTVYDKRLEQIYKVGSPWWKLWGFEKEDCPRVWRVEVRAGKKHLTDWGVKTFGDLEAEAVAMFGAAMQAVRMTAGRDESNVSRLENHPFWDLAVDQVKAALEPYTTDAQRSEILAGTREEILEMYRKQVMGLCVSYAVAQGMSKAEAAEELGDDLTAKWLSLAKGTPAIYGRKYRLASDRLHFLNEKGNFADADANGI